jgi:hypothetical protein
MSDDRLEAIWVDRADAVPPELWARCFGTPHEGEWLYRVLERSGLHEQFRFRYVLVRQGLRNVGLAPTFLMDVPLRLVVPLGLRFWIDTFGRLLPSLRSQRTLFVGSPCAEAGRVGLVPGVDPVAALSCIDAALRREMRATGATLRVWKDFQLVDVPLLNALARASSLFSVVSFPGTALDLSYASKEAYVRSLPKRQRHLFKKKVRRSQDLVNIEVEVVGRPDAPTLDAIFSLFSQTYDKSKTKFERLNHRFFELISHEPFTRFIVLREATTGKPVAFMLCFEFGDQLINKFIGLDYRRPREWLLYFRLWDAAVDRALAIGATRVLSGQTGYGPKVDLGHRLLPLSNYVAHRNPIIHRLYAAIARGIDWTTLDPALEAILVAHPELQQPPETGPIGGLL